MFATSKAALIVLLAAVVANAESKDSNFLEPLHGRQLTTCPALGGPSVPTAALFLTSFTEPSSCTTTTTTTAAATTTTTVTTTTVITTTTNTTTTLTTTTTTVTTTTTTTTTPCDGSNSSAVSCGTVTSTTTTTITTTTNTTTTTVVNTTTTTTTTTTTVAATGCATASCGSHWSGAISTAACNSLAATAAAKTDCAAVGNSLVTSCMTTTGLDVKCPAENTVAGTSPDLVEAGSVKCKVCGPTVSADKWPVVDKVWYTITFGALFDMSSSTPTCQEDKVKKYELLVLDSKQRALTHSLKATKVEGAVTGKYSTSCCTNDLHMITITGTKPSGMAHLLLTPVDASGVKLPSGYVTPLLTDSTTGTVKESMGSITMKFPSASAAAAVLADGKFEVVFIKALANTIADVTADEIFIVSVALGSFGSRRLVAVGKDRRLSTSHIIVNFKIMCDKAIASGDISVSELLTQFKAAATALGVTGASATAIAGSLTPELGTFTTTDVGTPAASSLAAPSATSTFSFVLVVGMMLATVFQ